MDERRHGMDTAVELVWSAGVKCRVRRILPAELDVYAAGGLVEGPGTASSAVEQFERGNVDVV